MPEATPAPDSRPTTKVDPVAAPSRWSRRGLLVASSAGVLASGVAIAATAQEATPAPDAPPATPFTPNGRVGTPVPTNAGAPLPQPVVKRSVDGVLAIDLVATPATVEMGVAAPVSTYTYDGLVPGNTWEVRAGDTLKIHLVNDLPELPADTVMDMVRPHQWTHTNLHTHGLHVSPAGNADNIFVSVAPGEEFDYEIPIPNDHQCGFFWYHPHRHGAVCQQVRAGMAGAIIVRGRLDDVPEIAAATEEILVLQAIELSEDFRLMDPIPHPSSAEAFFPRQQILYTVNGVLNPAVTMYPGEVRRWRILNAAEGKFMSIHLEDHDFQVLAWDGLTLPAPEPASDLMFTSGNRCEVLIQAGAPGRYDLVLSPGSSQHPDIPGMAHATPAAMDSGELHVRPILTVIVEGEGPTMALPTSLPVWNPKVPPVTKTRALSYTVERDGMEFLSFGVNGEPFDPNNPPYQVALNTTEEWTVTNDLDDKLPEHAHGFHIHVNPFKVTKINGETLETPLWRDTFAISGIDNDSITFEMTFTDFTGLTVNHCHVLSHEDLGMMEAIEIVP